MKLVALERLPPIEGAVEIRMYVTFLRGVTSPPRFARHLPLTRGGFFASAPKAPLVKGSWRAAPEGLAPPQRMASPMRGSCRRRRLMRWTVPRKRNCPTSSVTAAPCRLPLIGEGIGCVQIKNSPRKGADQQIWPAPSIDGRDSTATSYKFGTPVSGGA